jgi:toxin ParE1/3/4
MNAVLAPAARRDLLAAVRWIAKDNPAAARALRDGVVRAAERIGEHVHIGALRPELAGEPYRFAVVTGFPYVIVYNAERSPPLIVRILHGARDLPEILRGL